MGHVCTVELPNGGSCPVEVGDDVAATLVSATGRPTDDPWVTAVVAALAREPQWLRGADPRSELAVRCGGAEMFHVSRRSNRDSVLQHGLDWSRMHERGIAGSRGPEAPAIFLCDDRWNADWFARMGEDDPGGIDIWGVDASDDWIESGPDGWWMRFQPVAADRVRLVHP